MAVRLTTEDGRKIIGETVSGFTGASALNDALIQVITKDPLTVNPVLNGWTLGTGWAWNSTNGNLAAV